MRLLRQRRSTAAGEGAVILDNEPASSCSSTISSSTATADRLLAGSPAGDERHRAADGLRGRDGAPRAAVPVAGVAGPRWTREEGVAATLELLDARARPTALVASSVELALGALLACRELGVAIPDDLALATFDDAVLRRAARPAAHRGRVRPGRGRPRRPRRCSSRRCGRRSAAARDVTSRSRLVTRRSCGCAT